MSLILRLVGLLKVAAALIAASNIWGSGAAMLLGQQHALLMGAAAIAEAAVICAICFGVAQALDLLKDLKEQPQTTGSREPIRLPWR